MEIKKKNKQFVRKKTNYKKKEKKLRIFNLEIKNFPKKKHNNNNIHKFFLIIFFNYRDYLYLCLFGFSTKTLLFLSRRPAPMSHNTYRHHHHHHLLIYSIHSFLFIYTQTHTQIFIITRVWSFSGLAFATSHIQHTHTQTHIKSFFVSLSLSLFFLNNRILHVMYVCRSSIKNSGS